MTEIIEILETFSNEDPESPVQSPKEKAESLIKFMDMDNSGGITFDEFLKVVIFGVPGTKVNPHSIFVEIDFL